MWFKGGRHSSAVLSAPTILRPWVRIPSTPSMLFQFVLLKLYRENNENKKQKEAGIGPFLRRKWLKICNLQVNSRCLINTVAFSESMILRSSAGGKITKVGPSGSDLTSNRRDPIGLLYCPLWIAVYVICVGSIRKVRNWTRKKSPNVYKRCP